MPSPHSVDLLERVGWWPDRLNTRARRTHLSGVRYTLAALAIVVGAGEAGADNLPPIVAAAISEAKATCKPDPPLLGPGFIKRQDINGDGLPDFILSYVDVGCPQGRRVACNTGGCIAQVFASTKGGYKRVLEQIVEDVTFEKVRGRSAMLLGLPRSSCADGGGESCKRTLYWNGSKFSPVR